MVMRVLAQCITWLTTQHKQADIDYWFKDDFGEKCVLYFYWAYCFNERFHMRKKKVNCSTFDVVVCGCFVSVFFCLCLFDSAFSVLISALFVFFSLL